MKNMKNSQPLITLNTFYINICLMCTDIKKITNFNYLVLKFRGNKLIIRVDQSAPLSLKIIYLSRFKYFKLKKKKTNARDFSSPNSFCRRFEPAISQKSLNQCT